MSSVRLSASRRSWTSGNVYSDTPFITAPRRVPLPQHATYRPTRELHVSLRGVREHRASHRHFPSLPCGRTALLDFRVWAVILVRAASCALTAPLRFSRGFLRVAEMQAYDLGDYVLSFLPLNGAQPFKALPLDLSIIYSTCRSRGVPTRRHTSLSRIVLPLLPGPSDADLFHIVPVQLGIE